MADVHPAQLGMLLVCTVRYALGRSTYIVSDTVAAVRAHWRHVSLSDQAVIARDLRTWLDRTRELAHPIDAATWRGLLTWIDDTTTPKAPHAEK